uniref:Uncharacterized protein n=1 Tax=Rhizophora mucronata TaxID=61149 RepID=A0A2P2QRP8_RHIMU
MKEKDATTCNNGLANRNSSNLKLQQNNMF